MRLKDVAQYLGIDSPAVPDISVKNLQYDSRCIQPEDVFIAIVGTASDGHDYINMAVEKGASALIVEKPEAAANVDIPVLVCSDTRKAVAILAMLWHDFPDRKLHIIGVTGTNGKTTTTTLIKYLWEQEGIKSGLIGTVKNMSGDRILPATHTTPEPLQLAELLDIMVQDGCQNVVMEVSSHALKQERVEAIHFDGAAFTNMTQDHLDFHKTFEDYLNSKLMLFKMLDRGNTSKKFGIINIDDPVAEDFLMKTKVPVMTYGIEKPATLQAVDYHLTHQGTKFTLLYNGNEYPVVIPLTGKFNVYNCLAAMAVMLAEGMPMTNICKYLADAPQIPGRFEKIDCGQDFTVIVDYAHTPDGLENVLLTAREIAKQRLITVFGCGGDRDRTKRPIMGRISAKYSDYSVITSDNPRTEDPMFIISEVESGVKELTNCYEVEENRHKAIEIALKMAKTGDVVMIAGKGHEDYQLVNGAVLDFDDRKVAREILSEILHK
jgi:UDP-N-acetylmuramoyl-L-alanyl-D-glutamate--2,6-diaminopimelate ligase